jgi:hypothetical protein
MALHRYRAHATYHGIWSRWAFHGVVAILPLVLALAACVAVPATAPHALAATPTPADLWSALRQRPLHLPGLAGSAPCPAMRGHIVSPDFGPALGNGPVYPVIGPGADTGTMRVGDLNKVLWVIAPSYTGPALIRGHQLDGAGTLTFNGGLDQSSYQGDWHDAPRLLDLRLMGGPASGSPWPNFPTYTNVPAPGCYGYQVDGLNLSYALIFQAE